MAAVDIAKNEAAALMQQMPQKVADMSNILATKFVATSLTEVEQSFKEAMGSTSEPASNAVMVDIVSSVRSEVAFSLKCLQILSRWIWLMTPEAEDGNNFGVHVQQDVLKTIGTWIEKLEKELKLAPEYFKERAAVAEKMAPKISRTKTVSKSKKNDGSETKEESTEAEDEKSEEARSPAIPDQAAHLLAIDLQYYTLMEMGISSARDALLIVEHIISKNEKKITEPKGSEKRSNFSY
uniref:Proteasome activator PA28 C-terminal domain-containing protein n=1 Tax=Fibrocapsa japonica TaxID=94617 RepID=A0A7S2V475_9STRA|mmetsp:Transcript_654/g.949  ORF Transcript_654/g.949 Transcript_654/m.949 type:complete len:238 (+) Transcript_654:98-811(+)|eukprot:CAMPEP_0113944636 /NCGR_PEP_ID=MMETSP1339-20121228/35059_1 /TAXON_ID=94617 /ORGANISM="Fibrocapsa japonica" /LENGTH=237 /DNA_ID=CAMNT_0000949911 /DNA_START=77 /DNA_END=790 /DNA_ORIENTATION=+ /assembly_acc=CAM_ASM_000762